MNEYYESIAISAFIIVFGLAIFLVRYFLSRMYNESFEGVGIYEKIFYFGLVILAIIRMLLII